MLQHLFLKTVDKLFSTSCLLILKTLKHKNDNSFAIGGKKLKGNLLKINETNFNI